MYVYIYIYIYLNNVFNIYIHTKLYRTCVPSCSTKMSRSVSKVIIHVSFVGLFSYTQQSLLRVSFPIHRSLLTYLCAELLHQGVTVGFQGCDIRVQLVDFGGCWRSPLRYQRAGRKERISRSLFIFTGHFCRSLFICIELFFCCRCL